MTNRERVSKQLTFGAYAEGLAAGELRGQITGLRMAERLAKAAELGGCGCARCDGKRAGVVVVLEAIRARRRALEAKAKGGR